MNFFEAMKAADEGKIIVSCAGDRYRKRDESLYLLAMVGTPSGLNVSYTTIATLGEDEIKGDWEVYEEPKKEEKGLWEVSGHHTLYLARLIGYELCSDILLGNFLHESQRDSWMRALQTFMKLKGHPLAVKADDNYQFFIHISFEYAEVCPHPEKKLPIKMHVFSPMFETMADAEQALEDIGEEKLVKMTKVFQGIYE